MGFNPDPANVENMVSS